MNNDGEIRLTGALTAKEVPGIFRDSLAWKNSGLPARIDLSGLEQADSSAVALFLEWLSWARAAGRPMTFEEPPESLRIMASLSQADTLLGWESEA